MNNKLNVDLLMKSLSEILSDRHGCEVKLTARKKAVS